MKKVASLVLVAMLCLMMCGPANASEIKYVYYFEAVDEMKGIFADFAEELHEQVEAEGDISDIEFMLFFDYVRIWVDMNEVSTLYYQGMSGKGDTTDVDALLSSNDLFGDIVEEQYAKWEREETTKADAVINTWKIVKFMMQPEQ